MEILKCEGVRKVYGSGQTRVTALDGIDLSVDKGEFVAIIGASGSGKSTLLHILGSVDQPTEGKVIVEGTDISTMNRTQSAIFRRRKVGLVYQFYNTESTEESTSDIYSFINTFIFRFYCHAVFFYTFWHQHKPYLLR